MKLDGKIAAITGGTAGIGRGIAEAFAGEGAKVVVNGRNPDKGKQVVSELGEDRAVFHAGDATTKEGVEGTVETAVQHFGRIDIMVNNAGGAARLAPLVDLYDEDWDLVMKWNLYSTFWGTRAALRHMYRQGSGGSIVYIGSVHSKAASVLKAPYVTAKHGLVGLAKVVAKEGAAHGVRANVVCPGFVRTPLVDRQIPEQARELGITEEEVVSNVMLKETVDGEFTTVDDVAEAVLFCAAFGSKALTGQSLVVSHGWFMQ